MFWSKLYDVHIGERRPFTQYYGPLEISHELQEGEVIKLTIEQATIDPTTGHPWRTANCRIVNIDGNQVTALPLN